MSEQEALKLWARMTPVEKLKYNGFDGYLKGELYKDTSLFRHG